MITAPAGGAISGQAALINTSGWTWEDLAREAHRGHRHQPSTVVGRTRGSWRRWWWSRRSWWGRGRHRRSRRPSSTNFMKASQDYNTGRAAGSAKLDLLYESMRPLFRSEVPAIIAAGGEAGNQATRSRSATSGTSAS